jgi:hypothetical protein
MKNWTDSMRRTGGWKNSAFFFLAAYGWIVTAFLPPSARADAELEAGASQITEPRLREHVETLADLELEGRANGSEGAEQAARYIESQFEEIGLEPAGLDRFRHRFRVYSGVRVEGVIGMRDSARGYEFNKDYTPLGLSADGKQIAPLVFVGYGVSAPELGYDDYAGIDVAGKFVLAFLGEPGMRDPDSVFDGLAQTIHSDLYQKAETARSHGAAGLLLCPGPLYAKDPNQVWRISPEVGYRNAGLLVAQLSAAAAQEMVKSAGLELSKIQAEIDGAHQPRSQVIEDQQVELMVALRRVETPMSNLVGKIGGRSDDSIVLIANYDGFGMGNDSSRRIVHPSANFNATGVAALIEIGRAMKAMPKPKKTVYFVAASGRLLASVGAEALTREGVIPPGNASCAATMFALGQSTAKRFEIFGTGSGEGLHELVQSVNEMVSDPVDLRLDREIARSGDHIPFHLAGVPTLAFFGGAFEEYGTPADRIEIIQFPVLTRNARYIYGVVQSLAKMEAPIAFHP